VCVRVVWENEDRCVLYRAVKLETKARGLAEYKLGLLQVHEVRRDKGGPELAKDCSFFNGVENVYTQGHVSSS
jgi:hypothetical protein